MTNGPEHSPAAESAVRTARGRYLVICCDGTSNEFGRENTNVVRLLQCLKRDTQRQFIYCDPGVGTLPEPNRVTRVGKWWSKVIGLAFGHGLTADVMEAYTYLMEQWETGSSFLVLAEVPTQRVSFSFQSKHSVRPTSLPPWRKRKDRSPRSSGAAGHSEPNCARGENRIRGLGKSSVPRAPFTSSVCVFRSVLNKDSL